MPFQHLRRPRAVTSGVTSEIYFAPATAFAANGVATAAPGTLEIVTAHLFRTARGFFSVLCGPWKNKFSAETIGEPGSLKLDQKTEVVITGSHKDLHEFLSTALNAPGIVLIRDADDPTLRYQIGSTTGYAYVTAAPFETGTEKEGQKSYKLTISHPTKNLWLYRAPIALDLANSPLLFGNVPLVINAQTLLIN